MILEQLQVQGFRKIASPFTINPSERVTIVSGPNGTGKSTLLDALYAGLLERYDVSGTTATERFISRGRKLVPRIEIVFRAEGKRYRLRKSFLPGPSAVLEIYSNGLGRFEAFAEGKPADEALRRIFFAEPPGKGVVDPTKHWGLAHVLWAPGNAMYGALPAGAANQVRALLGGNVAATPAEKRVEERIAKLFLLYYTEKAKLAESTASANIPALRASTIAARTEFEQQRKAVAELDQVRRTLEDAEAEGASHENALSRAQSELKALRAAATAYENTLREQSRAAKVEEDLRRQHSTIVEAIEKISSLRQARDLLAAQRHPLALERATLEALRAKTSDESALLSLKLSHLIARRDEVVAGLERVTMAESYISDRTEAEALREMAADVEADLVELEQIKDRRAAIAAPSRQELKALRTQATERATLEARLAASAMTVELVPEHDGEIDVLAGDPIGRAKLKRDRPLTITGAPEVVVAWPGVGHFRVHAADVADVAAVTRSALAALNRAFHAVLERFGARSLPELEARADAAIELDKKLTEIETRYATRLGKRTLEGLRAEIAGLSARISAIEEAIPEWRDAPPDADTMRAAFNDEQSAARADVDAAAMEVKAKNDAVAALDANLRSLEERDRVLENQDLGKAALLESLESDGLDDEGRAAQRSRLSLEWDAANRALAAKSEDLAQFGVDPRAERDILQASAGELADLYTKALLAVKEARTHIDVLSQKGSYSRLAEAEERLEACEAKQHLEERQAEAALLLYKTLQKVRQRQVEAVLAPVAAAASSYLERIAGPQFGTIEVGKDFAPSGLRDADTGEIVAIASTLSAGEKEQIYLATRLALADVLAGATNERQLVVIDDALAVTDPARLRRFLAIVDELSRERMQFIIATADASRYTGLTGAVTVDLRKALAEHAA